MAYYYKTNLVLIFLVLSTSILQTTRGDDSWLNHGGDIYNRRYADKESKITSQTASKLRLKWKFDAGKDIGVTPAIHDGVVYFASWNGYIYAVKAASGSLVWKKNLASLTGLNLSVPIENVNTTVSRSTPTIAGDDLLVVSIFGPAYIVAMKRKTGELVWMTQLDKHRYAVITMSGTYYKGGFYVGVSSLEESNAMIATCCTFRGSFVKLDIKTGAILWQTYMIPDNQGKIGNYSGAAVWGSSPSIDARRNHVYIATGNLYSVPKSVEECQEKQNNQTGPPTHQDECIDHNIHYDSILALNLNTGKVEWYKQLGGYDVWFSACSDLSTPNCPPGPNPDADFGEAPMMLTVEGSKGGKIDIVVTVQKSGFAWALNRDNGELVWSTQVGPGGPGGGGIWGAATDTKRIYTTSNNGNHRNLTLWPSKNVTTSGAWVAMDAGTGRIVWTTIIPNDASSNPVTIANGVLLAGTMYQTGPVYAMDGKTGAILWSYETGASVFSGLSVSNGCAYVGNGNDVNFWALNPNMTAGTSLFAFCL